MRVFVDPAGLVVGEVIVRGDEHHYLARVRRMAVGDVIELVDGAGRHAHGRVVAIRSHETQLHVEDIERVPPVRPIVRVLLPLIKGDRMDDCIEKLVEVGVSEILVWQAGRSVVSLARLDRRGPRLDHYRAVAKAAARQSGCATIPDIVLRGSLEDALSGLPFGARIVLDPATERGELPRNVDDVTLVSGPEGGLTPEEHSALDVAGFTRLGLGPRVLRADTAPVVAVALLRAATDS